MPSLLLNPARPLCLLLAALVLTASLAGCDVQGDVVILPDTVESETAGAVEAEVKTLSTNLEAQRVRADKLEAEVVDLRGESIVLKTDDGFTFRLNPSAAVVLVFAIVGLVVVLVARMKFAADAARNEDAAE